MISRLLRSLPVAAFHVVLEFSIRAKRSGSLFGLPESELEEEEGRKGSSEKRDSGNRRRTEDAEALASLHSCGRLFGSSNRGSSKTSQRLHTRKTCPKQIPDNEDWIIDTYHRQIRFRTQRPTVINFRLQIRCPRFCEPNLDLESKHEVERKMIVDSACDTHALIPARKRGDSAKPGLKIYAKNEGCTHRGGASVDGYRDKGQVTIEGLSVGQPGRHDD
ncbi:hypothetical protein DFH07DRAFT_1029097 [Mycena maculata]|uniref:Uncharacterized protein n=1 Tax=Mycena maculata TaxID=230809 RepID=A0AAD7NC82_9AGAR|nr:hypothetical protein DFH07DRAFT_1029097 [Mycena maculata]